MYLEWESFERNSDGEGFLRVGEVVLVADMDVADPHLQVFDHLGGHLLGERVRLRLLGLV